LDHPKQFDYVVLIDGKVFTAFSNASANERDFIEVFQDIVRLNPGNHALQVKLYVHSTHTELGEAATEFKTVPSKK